MSAKYQWEHDIINETAYPGTREMCVGCDEPTGNAGAGDGSLLCPDCDKGPWCETCYETHCPYLADDGWRYHARDNSPLNPTSVRGDASVMFDEDKALTKAIRRARYLSKLYKRQIALPRGNADGLNPHWIHEPLRWADDGTPVFTSAGRERMQGGDA